MKTLICVIFICFCNVVYPASLRNKAAKLTALDPVSLKTANIGKGTGPVDLAQNYTNVKIYGLTDVKNLQVKTIDVDNFLIEMEADFPLLRWIGQYKASGRILLLPIYGDGDAQITMVNTRTVHKIRGELFTKKDKTYAKCNLYELSLFPEKVTLNFGNLFNGNKLLGDNMNKVMNDNWKDLFEDVKSGYEEVISLVLKNYCNQVFGRYPYHDIFL